MSSLTAREKWDAEVEALANRFDAVERDEPHYICDTCHDAGYVLTGGDTDKPCPECTYDNHWDGPYGPDAD